MIPLLIVNKVQSRSVVLIFLWHHKRPKMSINGSKMVPKIGILPLSITLSFDRALLQNWPWKKLSQKQRFLSFFIFLCGVKVYLSHKKMCVSFKDQYVCYTLLFSFFALSLIFFELRFLASRETTLYMRSATMA